MRKEGPDGPDQHTKEVVRRRRDKEAPFDAGIGLVQRIEVVDAESSVTQRKRSERPKVRRFAERAFALEHQRPQAVVGESRSQGPADAVKQIGSKGKEAVAEGAHTGSKAISSAAGKVKWPALAGGAALAGLAGGVALGAQRNSGRKILGMRVGQGRGEAGKNLADTSKNIGKFSENVGQFAAEMRKTREAIETGSKHSSPIEVALRALTARR